MVATKTLFMVEDQLLKLTGLYAMWTAVFISNTVALLVDDTQGPSRNFNVWANGLSVLYCGLANANNIFGNGLPSTMMVTVGPIHQYSFWHLFAYYGGPDVLGSHPVGVMNWVGCFLVGLFTVDMIVKTWYLALNPDKYRDYVRQSTVASTTETPTDETA